MKFSTKLLALAVSSFVLETSAFTVLNTNNAVSSTMIQSTMFNNPNDVSGQTSDVLYKGGYGGRPEDVQFGKLIDSGEATQVQGGALRTWPIKDPRVDRVLISLISGGPSEGNPCKAEVTVTQGPGNTPLTCNVYSGKGSYRKIRFLVENPFPHSSVFVRNTNSVEYPFTCRIQPCVSEPQPNTDMPVLPPSLYDMKNPRLLQGSGSVVNYPLDGSVDMAKVSIRTDGRPMELMIELIQGPNAPKYTFNLYTQNGLERPFYAILETPGAGNMIRIKNVHKREMPCYVEVEPFEDEIVPPSSAYKRMEKPKPISPWNY